MSRQPNKIEGFLKSMQRKATLAIASIHAVANSIGQLDSQFI